MDPKRFQAPEFGTPVKTPGQHGFWAFQPAPIPQELVLEPETVLRLSEADTALGRLAGAGRLLPDASILVGPYMTREALASSRIEGTQASLSEVFQANASGEKRAGTDVREVQNYIEAMSKGLGLLDELPVCLRLLRDIHGVLLTEVRGEDRLPGEFRRSPNWIGSPDDRPDTAIYVPPADADFMNEALRDWEQYVNDEDPRLPLLVRCGLLHYQFETIHPFLDGNGRLGRLFIVLFLVQNEKLPQPLLYVSDYFERHRQAYYDALQSVREKGAVQKWLRMFLSAIAIEANDAVDRVERLCDLREGYRAELAATRSRAIEVVDVMMGNPVLTVRLVQDSLSSVKQITHQGALNIVRSLEERGWLVELGTFGRGGRTYWTAPDIMEIVEGAQIPPASPPDEVTMS
ncbi:MAG: Fic/DOC family N-terminal domain-containing protein [Acidimicrobiia bacterium]